MLQTDVERLGLFFQVVYHLKYFQQKFTDFIVENSLDLEHVFDVIESCRQVMDDSALSSEVVELALMADAQEDGVLFFLVFFGVEDWLFEERFFDEFELGAFDEGVQDVLIEAIEIFEQTRSLRVPVPNNKIINRLERRIRGAVKNGQPVPNKVHKSFQSILRACKHGSLAMINGPQQVNISFHNNFGPAAHVLVAVLAFGVAVFDEDVVVVVVVVLVPVEF